MASELKKMLDLLVLCGKTMLGLFSDHPQIFLENWWKHYNENT